MVSNISEAQNFMPWSYFMIYLKLGLFDGSRYQHFFISFAKHSGVFFGIAGLMSLFSTYIDTCNPVKSIFYYLCTFERRLPRSYLPKNYPVTENISFLGIFLTCDHLRSHPLICPDFTSHIVLQPLCPSKVSKFYLIAIIKQKVEAF